jgi:hypothetical protein
VIPESQREIEGMWTGSETLWFTRGSRGCFIACDKVKFVISLTATVKMRRRQSYCYWAQISDTSQTYLQFLMLHACFTPIALCFVYTSWHFYAFSRTNLLTDVFVFQKSYTGNILGIGRNESQTSYLPNAKTESRGETETDQGAAAL